MNLNFILQLLGGAPGLISVLVSSVTKGDSNQTPKQMIETQLEHTFTISDHDNAKICNTFRITDPVKQAEALRLARAAGVAAGDYAAYLVEQKLNIS